MTRRAIAAAGRRTRYWAEWLALRAVTRTAQVLPIERAYATAAACARALFWVGGPRVRYALANLRIAYPAFTPAQRRALALSSFIHFAWNLVDVLRAEHWTPQQHLAHVAFKDVHHIEAALARGRGVLALIPHLGCFELAKRAAPAAGLPLSAIIRPFENRRVFAEIERASARTGVELIPHRGSLLRVRRALNQGRPVAVLNDQYMRRADGVWVPLFGRRCSTAPGVARLALRTGAAVVPCYVVRDGPEHHTMYFQPELAPPPGGDLESFVTAQNAALERIIRAHPEQWLWSHRRFRHSPDLDADPYA